MSVSGLDNASHSILAKPSRALWRIRRAARTAMLEFLNDCPTWEKRDFAQWLVESYAPVAFTPPPPEEPAPPTSRSAKVDSPALSDVITDARDALLSVLALDAVDRSAFASKILASGWVVPAEYGNKRGWVPITQPRMLLKERLFSLWAADFLGAEHEYETSLSVCPACGKVEFDAFARARGACRVHARSS